MPPKSNIPDQVCPTCSKTFYRPPCKVKTARRLFCSTPCFNVSQTHTAEQRTAAFWSRVSRSTPDECWLWIGGIGTDGYGVFSNKGHSTHASRAAWIFTNGAVQNKLSVLHKCDNPLCCNPSHLFLGTQRDNIADMNNKGRAVVLHGEQDPKSKLTEDQVRQIRQLYRPRVVSQFKLAAMFGVSRTAIQSVLDHRTWAHIE